MKSVGRGAMFGAAVAVLCSFILQIPASACSPEPLRIDERVIIVKGRALILEEQRSGEVAAGAFEHRGTAEVFPISTLKNELGLEPPFRFEFSYLVEEGCVWGAAPDGERVQELYLRVSKEKPYRMLLIGIQELEDEDGPSPGR